MTTASRLRPAKIVGGQIAPSPIPWQVSVQIKGQHTEGNPVANSYLCMLHGTFIAPLK